jgi:HAD superfamily hydrolase (TIGR01509 family)
MMLNTILFDLGNVLVNVDSQRPVLRLKQRFPSISEQRIWNFFDHSDLCHQFQTGKVSSHVFYEGFRDAVCEDFSYDYFKHTWQDMFSPIRPMIDLLPDLRARYRLVLLSNTDELHAEYIGRQYGFYHYFHHLIFSYEVACLKPGQEIFRIALEKSQSNPQQCVFIDDLEKNVQAAVSMGMRGILFKGYERFVQDWNELGEDLVLHRESS